MHADAQVLAVRARLVQEDRRVDEVAKLCGCGVIGHVWSVKRLTAAMIYVACGLSITRSRKVVNESRMALRGHRRDNEHYAQIYEQRLLENALVLAKRTTPNRQRRAPTRQP